MIGYLEGTLLKKDENRILVLANQVGYEVLLPAVVADTLADRVEGDPVSLYIYFHQTEKQPRPVLIGFNREVEKEFFELFISVADIGPIKAAKALGQPVAAIARAIEEKDTSALQKLPGIGPRASQKIVASLCGKATKFAMIAEGEQPPPPPEEEFTEMVHDVLIKQLGHKPNEARDMIDKALARNPDIATPEQLFDEIYRGER